ncbi:aspartate aminotransferase family protein [Tenacibaculum finnmarkense genomovar finnmarkense]|uniref:aspartate aminotransferase family protein n=1 Tax=Tenacibaculum finnmarkense TaxID=2781243 RepID=UPI001E35CECF|nr:aspartate aminotransferase family protein [Tenacibaculum finnmarkense]MCD8418115.1 aspartate aminotransferase family protein [Tenacibaculum finnmarkense genomovar finnmarkense]MCG8186484.1 aspartate aminotransferase family protein [Tenacibaculum finnmarkense genomovar finnmarkense]MCG8202970.1 aspartate aminotransferase family protein [Tenacibaculum finnmarkense genomovar finnmarkense]MCG8210247.1 aspartate aminotransferase family protein [Tenacibaculum finnmarkense genomovar finnmarkense]M
MKTDFLKYQGQTTPHPLAIEISHAKGSYIYDKKGKKMLDFVAGVSANSLGHNHPKVTQAIKKQLDSYTHVMVYGEFIQQPQLDLCKALAKTLPENLSSVYLVNSGTEATEGALKLVKRFTGRAEIIAAKNGYHGNTQGAMSVCGAEAQNRAFRPLIPGVKFIEFNNEIDLEKITTKTAGVILETIQGGAGFIEPKNDYLSKVKKRCEEVGALLILDEIQTGVGRTGKFWGFENYNVIPDIIITGKGLGGGMPIGAFIASFDVMNCLKENPKLGHITTFGGHPVIASAALATVDEITSSNLIKKSLRKEAIIRDKFKNHKAVKEIRGRGLMLALIVESPEVASKIILNSLDKGLILFWLLFEGSAIRITPPLTISDDEIKEGCDLILNELNNL